MPRPLFSALAAASLAAAAYPPPPPGWRSSFAHEGAYSGFSLESTPFFFRSRWYMMESQASDHFAPDSAAHSYFAVRDFASGAVVAAPPASSGFSFFSAIVDEARGTLWVFGAALDRFNATQPAPCAWGGHLRDNSTRCFIQAFSTTDLASWSSARALEVPAADPDPALVVANVAVALVGGGAPARAGVPAHWAFMALETTFAGAGAFAVNTRADGDLSRGWVLLDRAAFALRGPWQCPFVRFDAAARLYYVVGMAPGGTAPFVSRSRSLAAGDWEIGPPVSQGCAWGWEPCADGRVAPGVYAEQWASGADNSTVLPFLPNMSAWMWSTSDIDAADDGESVRYIWSGNAQSAPANFSGRSTVVSGLGSVKGKTVVAWLASLFAA